MNIQLAYQLITPCLISLAILEYAHLRYRRKNYDLKESLINFICALLHGAAGFVLKATLLIGVYDYLYDHGLKLFGVNSAPNILLLIIFQDFLYYLWHRASHRVRWMWAAHVVHHSSLNLNFSTGIRQPFTAELAFTSAFWMPLAYLGFQPRSIIIIVALNLLAQFIIHTEVIRHFHFLEIIFNSPSHHRVHHGSNPQYLDKNYGAILIIWDKLFGTFEPEYETPKYGLSHNIENRYNIFTVNFHEFISMIMDVIEHRDPRHLWMPPGWQPARSKHQKELKETR